MADSSSQASEVSQTAQDYINSQLELENEAREALPYVSYSVHRYNAHCESHHSPCSNLILAPNLLVLCDRVFSHV